MSVLSGLCSSCVREARNNWLSTPMMQDDWTRNNQLRQNGNFNSLSVCILHHLLPHLFLKDFEPITFKNCYSFPHTIPTQFISIQMFSHFRLHTHWGKYFVKHFLFFGPCTSCNWKLKNLYTLWLHFTVILIHISFFFNFPFRALWINS